MKNKISRKSQKKMAQDAGKGVWKGLIRIELVPAFAAWLACRHGFLLQSPDAGEILRAYRDGRTISIGYDGRRTICGRHEMALWHTFQCFCLQQ